MAWARWITGSTAGNITMDIDINVTSVTRTSNTNVRVTFGIRFIPYQWTYNSICAFIPSGGTRKWAFRSYDGKYHTETRGYYYANDGNGTTSETAPFTIDLPVTVTQTSASFAVGFGWNAWTPGEVSSANITVTFPTGATAPTGCWCSTSDLTETSVIVSGGYGSNGNATVTSSGYQYRQSGNSNWSNCSSSVTGLSPNTKYYFRYYATNSQGTSYSGETSVTTYDYPHPTNCNDFIIGNPCTISVYNPLGRTYSLRLISNVSGGEIGHYDGTLETLSGFNDSASQSQQHASIPNSPSGTFYVRVTYGSSVRTFGDRVYAVRGNETPTFESSNIIDVVDTLLSNTITGNNTKIIKGHNKITGKITKMSGNYFASGSKYVVNANATPNTQELNYDNGATKTFTFENLTTNSFNVTAYDTRGLYKTATKNVDLIEYYKPKINEFTVTRLNGLGEYINIVAEGTLTYWNGWTGIKKYNTVQKVYLRYKLSTESSWGSWKDVTGLLTINSNGNWEISGTLDDVFNVTKKYDFELYITDLLENSSTSSTNLSTANGFLWRDLENKRLGINKKPEKTLDINGDLNIDGDLYIKGIKVIWDE